MVWATEVEDGSGPIAALAGVGAFLAFLLLAAQVLLHLYTTSVVSAAAFDAARLASASSTPDVAREHGLALLGDLAARVTAFDVSIGSEDVTVHVAADSPALLPATVTRALRSGGIDRTVRMRRERVLP